MQKSKLTKSYHRCEPCGPFYLLLLTPVRGAVGWWGGTGATVTTVGCALSALTPETSAAMPPEPQSSGPMSDAPSVPSESMTAAPSTLPKSG